MKQVTDMWKKLIKDFEGFMKTILEFTGELRMDVSDMRIDHAALRFKKTKDVKTLEKELVLYGRKLSEAIVNGRKIFIFKLHRPLKYKNIEVNCVELPYPADKHDYPIDGWEHAEFVLEGSSPSNLEEIFQKRFTNLNPFVLKKYNYRITTPIVTGEKLVNRTIALEKHKGLAVKFHSYPIEAIVVGTR